MGFFFSSALQSVIRQFEEQHLPRTVFRYQEVHSPPRWSSLVTRKESSSRMITLMLFNITLKHECLEDNNVSPAQGSLGNNNSSTTEGSVYRSEPTCLLR